jgi:hypothetical protein
MNRKAIILFVTVVLLIGGTASLLASLRVRQKLGPPAVRTTEIPGSIRLEVELPSDVLDYDSEPLAQQQKVLDYLPKDTSFGQRIYTDPDGRWTLANVVLMGTDRTSLHKPQFCLEGQGWKVNDNTSKELRIHMERPFPYDLPVMKLMTSKIITDRGQQIPARGIYVYWFVAPGAVTAKHWQRMWWMARDLFRTGVLQRWAYVSYFTVCPPGQEEATLERMKKLIVASVPEFQLTPAKGHDISVSATP